MADVTHSDSFKTLGVIAHASIRLRAGNVRLKDECKILKCNGVLRDRCSVKYAWINGTGNFPSS